MNHGIATGTIAGKTTIAGATHESLGDENRFDTDYVSEFIRPLDLSDEQRLLAVGGFECSAKFGSDDFIANPLHLLRTDTHCRFGRADCIRC